ANCSSYLKNDFERGVLDSTMLSLKGRRRKYETLVNEFVTKNSSWWRGPQWISLINTFQKESQKLLDDTKTLCTMIDSIENSKLSIDNAIAYAIELTNK